MPHSTFLVRTFMFLLLLLALLVPTAWADGDDFTVVLLPDPQYCTETYPETYRAQTEWIKQHVQDEKIRFVIHLGDIVNNFGEEEEWRNADRAQRVLDGCVPYSVLPGNHDLDHRGEQITREAKFYNQYFPVARFQKYPWYGGHFGEDNKNNYCFFEGGGKQFLVLSLEHCPPDDVLDWAGHVAAEHPKHQIIVATHSYLDPKGYHPEPMKIPSATQENDANAGAAIWEKLVRKHPNIFLVVCGHVVGVAHRTSTNDAGQPVHELLADYQYHPHGGDGWLVRLRFQPKENRISVEPYSPTLNQEQTDPNHRYTLAYPMSDN